MTRTGKIARLPRHIRDELNRRLDDGEKGVRLIEWLNELPEVKQVLARDFEGRPIAKCNLTEWKNGGYLDWQSRNETAAFLRETKVNGDELRQISPTDIVQPAATVVLAHYAQAIVRSLVDENERPRARVRRLSRPLREMNRIMRREVSKERMQIEIERLQFEQEKLERKSCGAGPNIPHSIQTPTDRANGGGLTKFDPV